MSDRPDDVHDAVLSAFEASLDAQLRAVRRLRKTSAQDKRPRKRAGRSQVDMAYDVLQEAGGPLQISELLAGIKARFGAVVDRESLVSSLSKKIQRRDRFTRVAKNTFALISDKE